MKRSGIHWSAKQNFCKQEERMGRLSASHTPTWGEEENHAELEGDTADEYHYVCGILSFDHTFHIKGYLGIP